MICFHASHEQFPPGQLLTLSQLAKDSGFEGITCSDHFHPWSRRQGQRSSLLAQLRSPGEFESAAMYVRPEDMRALVRISPDLGQQIQWLREDLEMGFSAIGVHNVNRNQESFIRDFGGKISGMSWAR